MTTAKVEVAVEVKAGNSKAELDKVTKSANAAKEATGKLATATAANAKAQTAAAASTHKSAVSMGAMRGQVMESIGVLREAGGMIDKITASNIAAGNGTDIFTKSWIGLKKAMDDPRFFSNMSDKLADLLTDMDPFLSMTNRIGQGFGDHRRGVGLKRMDDVAGKMLRSAEAEQARNVANATAGLLGSQKLVMSHVKSELGDRKAITHEIETQANVLANGIAVRGDQSRVGDMQRRARANREEPFAALDSQFIDARGAFEERRTKAEEERLARVEEAKFAANEAAKSRHEEEMARQDQLQAKYEMVGASAGDSVSNLAQMALAAGDLSASGFKKVLAAWGKAESIRLAGVAISEGVQALVSLATFNYPAAAMHGAAAGAALAGAATIAAITGAAGGFGGGQKNVAGFGGDAFGGGMGPGAANDTPHSNSQADQLPTANSQEAHAAAGSGKGSSGTVVNISRIDVTGQIDQMTAHKIARAVKDAERKLGKIAT